MLLVGLVEERLMEEDCVQRVSVSRGFQAGRVLPLAGGREGGRAVGRRVPLSRREGR